MQSDTELLRRFVDTRSNDAFSELVSRHLNFVYFSALRRTDGHAHLAEDVTQLVFIALAREAPSLRAHTVLAGWLYIATRNAAAKAMRTEQRRTAREQEAFAMQESSLIPNQETDWDRIRPQLDAVLDELDERDRDAVLLRYFQNSSFPNIGATLRISSDAARMRVDRALEKLRALLAHRGVTSTTAALAVALENQATTAAAPAGLAAIVKNALLASGAISDGAATLSGSFQPMSATSITSGIAGLVSILAIGSAIYQANRVRQAEASLAVVSQTSAERIHDLQARLATAEKSRAAAAQSLQQSKSTTSDPTPASEAQKKQKKAAPTISFSESMKDPAYAAAWRKQALRTLERMHGDGFAALNLSSETLVRLKELLLARHESTMDARDAARAAGLTHAETNKAVQHARELWTDKIKELTGETGYTEFHRSEKASMIKPEIESTFAIDLKAAGIPPSPVQVKNLAATMFEYWENTWQPAGLPFQGVQSFMKPQEVNPQTGLTPHAQALLGQYVQYLTPAQHDVVKGYFIEQVKWTQLSRKQ